MVRTALSGKKACFRLRAIALALRLKTKKALDPEFGPKTFAVFPLLHFVVLDSGTL